MQESTYDSWADPTLSRLAGALAEGATGHDVEGRLIFANRAARELDGVLSVAEGWPERYRDLRVVDASRAPVSLDALPWHEAFRRAHPVSMELCLLRANGEESWVRASTSVVASEHHSAGIAFTLWSDVTELVETRTALDRQACIMHAQREASPAGILVVGPDGRLTYWNQRFLELWSLSEPMMASGSGRAVLEAVAPHARDPERFRRSLLRLMSKKKVRVTGTELELRDGRTFEFHSSPLTSRSDEYFGRVWFIRDVTERKRSEQRERLLQLERTAHAASEAARRRFEFLSRIADALSAPVDREVGLSEVVALCASYLGDLCVLDLLEGEQDVRRRVAVVSNQLASVAELFEAATRDGQFRGRVRELVSRGPLAPVQLADVDDLAAGTAWVFRSADVTALEKAGLRQWTGALIRGRSGPLGLVTLCAREFADPQTPRLLRDVTSHVALALDNVKLLSETKETVAVRDEFLNVAAHELRTPLTALRLSLQTTLSQVKEHAPHAGPLFERVELSLRQARRISDLIERLLDVSRLAAGTLALERSRIDLGELVADIVKQMEDQFASTRSDITLTVEQVYCFADRSRMEQVISNLLSNALKHGEGAPVEVTVERQGAYARLTVRDHGPGIAEEDLPRIFERYYRAGGSGRVPGLGLGLYLVRWLVEAHGGSIRALSRRGEGATFVIELPAVDTPTAPHSQ